MRLFVKHYGTYPRTALYILRWDEARQCERLVETVTAACPQMIEDYITQEWPTGTRVNWVLSRQPSAQLLPRLRRTIAEMVCQ